MVTSAMKSEDNSFLVGTLLQTYTVLESKNNILLTKVHIVKAMVFPVVVYSCEIWTIKKPKHQNWRFQTGLLEKTLESPLDSKEIKSVNLKGNQPWILIWRTDGKAEAPILWSPDVTSWLIEKALILGKIEGRRTGGVQRIRRLDGITDAMDMNLGKLQEMVRDRKPGVLQSMESWTFRHN